MFSLSIANLFPDQVNSGLSRENVLIISCKPVLDQVTCGLSKENVFAINYELVLD